LVAILKNGAGRHHAPPELDRPFRRRKNRPPTPAKSMPKTTPTRRPVMHALATISTWPRWSRPPTSWPTANNLARHLMLIGQPPKKPSRSKEDDRDGLFTRFPKRRSASLSTSATSFPRTNWHHSRRLRRQRDSLRITIYGKGGHGAGPIHHDPSSSRPNHPRLQTNVSREVKPETWPSYRRLHPRRRKNNIIPDRPN